MARAYEPRRLTGNRPTCLDRRERTNAFTDRRCYRTFFEKAVCQTVERVRGEVRITASRPERIRTRAGSVQNKHLPAQRVATDRYRRRHSNSVAQYTLSLRTPELINAS